MKTVPIDPDSGLSSRYQLRDPRLLGAHAHCSLQFYANAANHQKVFAIVSTISSASYAASELSEIR